MLPLRSMAVDDSLEPIVSVDGDDGPCPNPAVGPARRSEQEGGEPPFLIGALVYPPARGMGLRSVFQLYRDFYG